MLQIIEGKPACTCFWRYSSWSSTRASLSTVFERLTRGQLLLRLEMYAMCALVGCGGCTSRVAALREHRVLYGRNHLQARVIETSMRSTCQEKYFVFGLKACIART